MDDLISRRAAIEAVVYELDMIDHVPQRIFDRLTRRIKELPSIFQLRKGKWEIYATFDDCYYAKCDQCHETQVFYYNKQLTNFCPNCGADMREGDLE